MFLQVTGFCRSPVESRKPISSIPNPPIASTPSRQLSDSEKLRKVIMELVDTEKAYVKVNHLEQVVQVHGRLVGSSI